MSDVEIHELAAAYALDALDPAERAAYEAHFAGCASCRAEVGGFRETTAALATLNDEVAPADLRARVLQAAATTRQLAPRRGEVVELATRRRRSAATLLAVAAATAALVAGVFVVAGRGSASFNEQVAAMMDDPTGQMVALAPTGEHTGSLLVVWDDAHVAVMGHDLGQAADGSAYELWMIDDAGPHAMGLLDPAHDGAMRRMLDVPSGATAIGWGITVEPAEGSPVPTTPVIFHADV